MNKSYNNEMESMMYEELSSIMPNNINESRLYKENF